MDSVLHNMIGIMRFVGSVRATAVDRNAMFSEGYLFRLKVISGNKDPAVAVEACQEY